MNLARMVPLLVLTPLLSCATTGARGSNRCAGGEIALDVAIERCLVDGLERPERIAPDGALDLQVSLRGPTEPGGSIGVDARVVNTSAETLEVDIATQALRPDPRPLLVNTDGFRVENDLDPSCDTWSSSGPGGLGASPTGKKAVARVTLGPGAAIVARRTVPARNGLCVCAPDDAGVLDIRCAVGEGGPVAAGTYGVSVVMPVAVVSDERAFTYLSVRAPLVLAGE